MATEFTRATDRAVEQDLASGGRDQRDLQVQVDSVVTASVSVRQFKASPNQRYAYLQFKYEGKTVTKYIGRVTAESRAESLRIGWALLRKRKLVKQFDWNWVAKAPK